MKRRGRKCGGRKGGGEEGRSRRNRRLRGRERVVMVVVESDAVAFGGVGGGIGRRWLAAPRRRHCWPWRGQGLIAN